MDDEKNDTIWQRGFIVGWTYASDEMQKFIKEYEKNPPKGKHIKKP